MPEIRGPSKQTLGYTASAVRLNEFEAEWWAVLYDADDVEIWRAEEADANLFGALWNAEREAKDRRKEIQAGLERLTSGDSAETIVGRLFKDKKPGSA